MCHQGVHAELMGSLLSPLPVGRECLQQYISEMTNCDPWLQLRSQSDGSNNSSVSQNCLFPQCLLTCFLFNVSSQKLWRVNYRDSRELHAFLPWFAVLPSVHAYWGFCNVSVTAGSTPSTPLEQKGHYSNTFLCFHSDDYQGIAAFHMGKTFLLFLYPLCLYFNISPNKGLIFNSIIIRR